MREWSVTQIELPMTLRLVRAGLAVELLHFIALCNGTQHHFTTACVGSILAI